MDDSHCGDRSLLTGCSEISHWLGQKLESGAPRCRSKRLAESEIQPLPPEQPVLATFERQHTVESQPRRPAPHDHVTVRERNTRWPIGPALTAPLKDGGKTQRHRHDGIRVTLLVPI